MDELLIKYAHEPIANQKYQKISEEMKTRSFRQVAGRVSWLTQKANGTYMSYKVKEKIIFHIRIHLFVFRKQLDGIRQWEVANLELVDIHI